MKRLGTCPRSVSWWLAITAASAGAPSIGITAQGDTVSGAPRAVVPLLTGDRALSDLGAGVTVLDVDSLRREFPVRTLTELLMGRVPGVEVLPSSGEVGAGLRIMIRGISSFMQSGAPQVYVDGIRVNDDAASMSISVGGQTTSRVDDLDVETISAIAILPGPAAAVLYGTGATNGVLLITTKRGAPGRARFRAFTSQGLTAQSVDFPTNYRAVDSAGASCSPAGVASGACRLTQGNVFGSPLTSPLRTGYVRQYGLSASGGTAVATYALHGQWDGLGGVYGLPAPEQARLTAAGGLHPEVLNPNYLRRVALQGTGQLVAGPHVELGVTGGYFTGDLRLPTNDSAFYSLLASGLLGGTTPGSWFIPPGDLFQVTTLQHVERVRGTVAGTWRPLLPLSVRAVVGIERTEQHDGRQQRPGEGPNSDPAFSSRTDGYIHDNRLTAQLVATAAFRPWPGVSLRTTIGIHHYRRAVGQVDSSASVLGSSGSFSETRWWDTSATTGLFLAQEVAVRDRLVVTSALRRDVTTRAFWGTDPAVLYPQVGVSWRGPVPESVSAITAWRLRAAYGAVGGTRRILVPFSQQPGLNQLIVLPQPERSREIEGGLDAELLRGRVTFSATVYDKRSTHIFWLNQVAAPSYGGPQLQDDSSAVSNKGIDLALTAALVRGPTATWSIGVSAWGNRNRVVQKTPLPVVLGCSFGICQGAEVDAPLAGYWGRPILGYGTPGQNGVLAPGNVQVGPSRAYLGTPFPTEGASLSSTLAWGGRIQIAALLEYRSGHTLLNATEAWRCLGLVCRAATDPSTPVADQVPWAAWQAGTGAGWVESARFLKLREVSVGVIAPRSWSDHLGAEEMTVTLSGRNLVTWTSYAGLDPEVSGFGPTGLSIRDIFTQPPTRVWSARLDLSF